MKSLWRSLHPTPVKWSRWRKRSDAFWPAVWFAGSSVNRVGDEGASTGDYWPSASIRGARIRVELADEPSGVRSASLRRGSVDGSGAHIFDLLEVWLGTLEIADYRDDSRGGVEAVALIKARSKSEGGDVSGEVFLSRAYKAVNRTRIICERGYIDVDPHKLDSIIVVYKTESDEFVMTARADERDPFARQLSNFIEAVEVGEDRLATASSAVRAIELVESCYGMRQSLPEPWTTGLNRYRKDCYEARRNEDDGEKNRSNLFLSSRSSFLRGSDVCPHVVGFDSETGGVGRSDVWPAYEKILVTGAAGSVGSRLVEMWADRGCLDQIRCMARGYRTAARIMRFPADVAEADLLDRAAVRKAAHGCDAIIHLGVGEQAERETQIIVDVARELGVRRFVHLSTAAVYGRLIPRSVEELQEDTKVVKTGEPYADQKAKAEQMVVNACRRGIGRRHSQAAYSIRPGAALER